MGTRPYGGDKTIWWGQDSWVFYHDDLGCCTMVIMGVNHDGHRCCTMMDTGVIP